MAATTHSTAVFRPADDAKFEVTLGVTPVSLPRCCLNSTLSLLFTCVTHLCHSLVLHVLEIEDSSFIYSFLARWKTEPVGSCLVLKPLVSGLRYASQVKHKYDPDTVVVPRGNYRPYQGYSRQDHVAVRSYSFQVRERFSLYVVMGSLREQLWLVILAQNENKNKVQYENGCYRSSIIVVAGSWCPP